MCKNYIHPITELGALFVALLAIVLLIVVPLIRYSNKNASQTVVILDKIISKSDERNRQQYEEMINHTKECQGKFVSALKTVEERHEHSMKAVANATAGKLDTIIETTTVLMQQNERLANDINQVIQNQKLAENYQKLEKELIAMKENIAVNGKNNTRL